MNVLEVLRDRVAGRKRSAEDTVLAAARRLSDGENVNVDELDGALAESGHTPDSFAQLVEVMTNRRAWRADLDRSPAAEAKVAKSAAAVAAAETEREDWLLAWSARVNSARTEHDAAAALVARARDARAALTHPDNCPGPVGNRVRAARDAEHAALVEVERIKRERRQAAEREASERGWEEEKRRLNKVTPAGGPDDHKRLADRFKRRVAELDVELAQATKAHEAAVRDLAAAEAAALKL
jgi:hypothetical protein